ncbi:MAG TPA: YggS family pyridoxal phosphate-dependent enzyme [Bacteroidetes bacterium]|nr:YggS family pyridoxal phosphate-dependent enzyme [Bacteroidota bacterium]
MIAQNLEAVRERIVLAAEKAGRTADAVELVAVSKTKPTEMVREAVAAGQIVFGENRPQELAEKQRELPDLQWHFIGGLQRNKVKYIAEFVALIHSVDSEKLLMEINKRAAQHGRIIDCLFQINISDEPQKGGFSEAECGELLGRMADFPHVCVRGLMGMASFTANTAIIRQQFKRLKSAFEQFRKLETEQVQMRDLSMGMSGDYEIAIEEGATLVRVGSAIFGGR